MKKYSTIFIAGINRSGGSLLARLFDGHSNVLSYPIELGFPTLDNFYKVLNSYGGVPQTIPDYDSDVDDIFELLEIPSNKPKVITKWGKEQSDPIGVRENYLEKVFYGNVETSFDFNKFISLYADYAKDCSDISSLYDARHNAYFQSWDAGKHINNQSNIMMHSSGGIYLSNIDKFYNQFQNSKIIFPIRDVMGYVAAEKTRLARRYYGSRRFAWPQLPNIFVKNFRSYDLSGQIYSWLSAMTRVKLLQEKYGIDSNFIVYRHERLTAEPVKTMQSLSSLMKLDYEEKSLIPSIAGQSWLGNSQYGPLRGISNSISKNYSKVLSDNEIKLIHSMTDDLTEELYQQNTPIDLLSISNDKFFDYKYQKKYIDDEEKISLYYSLVNASKRSMAIKTVEKYAIIAVLYSIFVRIMHIPRMIKIKYFNKTGKQNYT